MNVNVNLMEYNVTQINGGITINVGESVKSIIDVKKEYVWNPSTCICESGKYLPSIMDDSVITFDKVVEPYNEDVKAKSTGETKTIPTNFYEKI